jgi:TctA family transporter
LSGGSPIILLTRPISITLIILTAVLLVFIRKVLYKPQFREAT